MSGNGDYISREAAFEECDWYANEFSECEYAIMPLKGALEILPAADVKPVVRGKWILYKDRDSTGKFEYVQWSCSACKSNVRTGQPRFDNTLREKPRFNFCPNCGCAMEGTE